MEPTYRVFDVSNTKTEKDLEDWLNEADERGYELMQVLESRGLHIILRRKAG